MEQYISQEFPDGASVEAAILRAKSGGAIDTALQNNDPRQWGLGADSILVDSLDNALETGWYKSNGATPASGYWNCLTERYNSQSITQTAVEYDNYGASIARRMLSLGVFGPWEWVNPPMQLGIEYRTTERYQGKPVYVKAVDCGAMPASTNKNVAHGIENISAIVSCTGYFTYGKSVVSLPYARGTVTNVGSIWASETDIVVWADNSNYTNYNAYGIIKCTKTTD